MGSETSGLGCYLPNQDENGSAQNQKTSDIILDQHTEGKLKSIPVKTTDKDAHSLILVNGTELYEYSTSGTWVETGGLHDGAMRYISSTSHGGHLEMKPLFVLSDNVWHNVVTGRIESNSAV